MTVPAQHRPGRLLVRPDPGKTPLSRQHPDCPSPTPAVIHRSWSRAASTRNS
jgi:hypothetical protein